MNPFPFDYLVPIFFGYPALITTIICSAIGIHLRKPLLLIIGSIISFPPAFYIGSTPLFRFYGYGLPLFPALAAYALIKGKYEIAWLCVIPIFALTLFVVSLPVL